MRITYDSDVNAAYIALVESIGAGEVALTHVAEVSSIGRSVNLDFDSDGRLLGVEVLGANTGLRAETLHSAGRAGPSE
ncbi:DUF2283 domain-containing protein [Flexivirga sp. B27]